VFPVPQYGSLTGSVNPNEHPKGILGEIPRRNLQIFKWKVLFSAAAKTEEEAQRKTYQVMPVGSYSFLVLFLCMFDGSFSVWYLLASWILYFTYFARKYSVV
jgi:hypothetical protein